MKKEKSEKRAVHRVCTRESIIRTCMGGEYTPQKLEGVAESCRVTPGGLFNIWPFSVLGVKATTCSHLMAIDTKEFVRSSIDNDIFRNLSNSIAKPHVDRTNYNGFVENGVFALIYLLTRHANECVVLTNFRQTVTRIMKDPFMTLDSLNWSDISLYWGQRHLTVPGNNRPLFEAQVSQCLSRPTVRFLLSLVTIVGDTGVHHANILLYDKHTGLLERFDPYQTQLQDFHTDELDAELEALFASITRRKVLRDLRLSRVRFIKPVNVQKKIGFGLQELAEGEGAETTGDPIGFCQPWTIMYADARMSLPNQDPATIPELLQSIAKDKNIGLTELIRPYSQHLHEVNKKVLLAYMRNKGLREHGDRVLAIYGLFLDQLLQYASVLL